MVTDRADVNNEAYEIEIDGCVTGIVAASPEAAHEVLGRLNRVRRVAWVTIRRRDKAIRCGCS